jgi:hypothetical protein
MFIIYFIAIDGSNLGSAKQAKEEAEAAANAKK